MKRLQGQYCHAFCTYCFRWAQFTSVGSDQTFKTSDRDQLLRYIQEHPMVNDVLFTGGDPMVMDTATLRHYLGPLYGPGSPPHLNTIRIGTKSLAWWPYRYVTDPDAKETLELFSEIVKSGKHLTIQAHFSHPREVEHPVAQEAIRLIRMTGAQIRSQAPLIRNVNDDADTWEHMWKLQTRLGIVPYYMFVERDTGAREYFSVPLARASQLFNTAYSRLPGTARTVRGPSMSASPGKVCVLGQAVVHGEKCFVLKFLQARNPEWSERVFFAKFDPEALWFDDLKPAFGEKEFFFTREYEQQKQSDLGGSSGQLSDADWGANLMEQESLTLPGLVTSDVKLQAASL
jgi:L-lysine 2,3-aminomutase